MKVPINPRSNVPTGQLGYERPVDVSSGTKALGQVVSAYAKDIEDENKKREIFDVQRLLVDETNNIQTDFEDKTKVEPLGAPNFTQRVNGEYNTRHTQMVADLKAKGYSDEAVNEFATRLGTIRSQYVARAIDFQDKSIFSKVANDADQMVTSLSQYASKNPNAVGSALNEFKVALTQTGLDQIEQAKLYDKGKGVILKGAQDSFAIQHPEVVLGLYGLPNEITTTSPVNLPAGQEFNLPSYIGKMNGAEGTKKNPRSSAVGFGQFLDSTWLGTYKQVFGNTGETNAQILAKKKDKAIATRLAEKLTANNVQGLVNANKPVNDGTVYLSHFLGIGDALKVLSAHADATISKLVHSASIKSNPEVFKKIKTAGDMLAWAQDKMGQADVPWYGTKAVSTQEIVPIPKGWKGNAEDAVQELGMTADQAEKYLRTGKDTRTGHVVPGLITPGNIDVSKLPAVPNPDGGVSTVLSMSFEQDGKEYLIPTVVNGQIVSRDEAIVSFQQTGKHLGVFKDAKSATAYAQQLHENEAQRVGNTTSAGVTMRSVPTTVDATGQTGIPVLDLSSGPERMAMLTIARTIMNGREADAKASQNAAHAAWLDNFKNQVYDGKLGQADIDNAYKSGQLSDWDERHAVQSIFDSKNKSNDDLARFHLMLQSGQKFNPYDNDAQKAVDAGFENAVKFAAKQGPGFTDPFTIALRAWERTGILPKAGGIMIRGALISTDQKQFLAAAAVASNMIRQNPNAFAGVEGESDIEHAAVNFGHYIYDFAMSPNEAAIKIAAENDPKYKEKIKYNDPAKQEALKTLRANGLNATTIFSGAKFPNPDALGEANQTYFELIGQQLDRGLDMSTAMAQAKVQMQKVYGPNFHGVIVKYPPERGYPQISGSWNYIYADALQTVKDETKREPISINLVPIPGVTDQDFRTGRLPRYRLLYTYKSGDGQTVVDTVRGQFAADITKGTRDAAERNKKEFSKARRAQIARGPSVFMPGIGEVR